MTSILKNNPKLIKDIQSIGEEVLNHDEFKKFENPVYGLEEERDKSYEKWLEIHRGIIDILKKYCDLKEEYYNLIALWIIGTHFHSEFFTFPYLFLNAMKGSGKTRLLKLITMLSKGGQMLNSLTEAVLFRTEGTLGIDEFEGITRKGGENLRELLNSAYKKGTTVKRMRKAHTKEGEEQVVEEFEVFRPIAIANIWGMESVLGDRCITLIIERSSNSGVTRLIENFEQDRNITHVLKLIRESGVCGVVLPLGVYTEWNDYIVYKHNTTHTNNNTKHHLLDKIYNTNINGRHLELSLPLFVIAGYLGEKVLDDTISTIRNIIKIKNEEEFVDNIDVSVIDFVSGYTSIEFTGIKQLVQEFKGFVQEDEPWINPKWFGRALKRLNLILEKRNKNTGAFVRLDIEKAQEKIRMFK